MEKMFETGKRQLPSMGGTAKKKKEGECAGLTTARATEMSESKLSVRPKVTKCKKFLGYDYLMGFKPDPNYNYDTDTNPDLIPEGALPEHRPYFKDIWSRYNRKLQSTNGMDIDTFPGSSMLISAYPVVLVPDTEEYVIAMELIELALDIYNESSNDFKYNFLKIEKVNQMFTGYLSFFMTVKVTNVTLGTVIETFQIYAGESNCMPYQAVFSCVPKTPLM